MRQPDMGLSGRGLLTFNPVRLAYMERTTWFFWCYGWEVL